MFDIFFVVFLVFFSVISLLEILVFNEEILLALCFFSFIFFCFNSLSDSIYDSLIARASGFETALLASYAIRKEALNERFARGLIFRGLSLKLQLFFISFTSHSQFAQIVFKQKFFKLLTLKLAFETLSSFASVETKLIESWRNSCISFLLYPFIFKSAKLQINSLIGSSNFSNISVTSKSTILKSLAF